MNQPSIQVQGLSKMYHLGADQRGPRSFRDSLVDILLAPIRQFRRLSGHAADQREFWALRDVSFDVQAGEVVGIIGRNGAGKSTLLKVLSRIVDPTAGRVVLRGRVASLLEVGTGFHPELTGRENIYLNGSILGMRRKEITSKFDDIVEFADVAQFLDTPVKRYSSGMYVRLAFAVAAHLEPEILIVDEVLAVGDIEFQRKCLGKMKDIAAGGDRTVLFVSHNMTAVQTLCDTGVLLQGGAVVSKGAAADVVAQYLAHGPTARTSRWDRPGGGTPPALAVTSVALDLGGSQPNHELHCRVHLRSSGHHPSAIVAVDVLDTFGSWLMQAVPRLDPFISSRHTEHVLEVDIDLPPLIPGTYLVGVWVGSSLTETLDWAHEVVEFQILESPTPGRTLQHSRDRGFVVPASHVRHQPKSS